MRVSPKRAWILLAGCLAWAAAGCREASIRAGGPGACCASAGSATNEIHLGPRDHTRSASLLVTDWLEPKQRLKSLPPGLTFTNEAGEAGRGQDLLGKPIALSFIYTRCENPNKCARVADTMAALENEVEKAGLHGQVRLALITYDPEFDTPVVLAKYGARHGLRFDGDTMMLRLEPADKNKFFDEFQVAVNFNSSGVNIHGIQLLLFDAQGRWVRTHHTLIWNNAEVLRDLQVLAREAGGSSSATRAPAGPSAQ